MGWTLAFLTAALKPLAADLREGVSIPHTVGWEPGDPCGSAGVADLVFTEAGLERAEMDDHIAFYGSRGGTACGTGYRVPRVPPLGT
jgi:hypothetical protein